jgi:hypothetical protein
MLPPSYVIISLHPNQWFYGQRSVADANATQPMLYISLRV